MPKDEFLQSPAVFMGPRPWRQDKHYPVEGMMRQYPYGTAMGCDPVFAFGKDHLLPGESVRNTIALISANKQVGLDFRRGNLVLSKHGNPYWDAHLGGRGNTLVMQPDGNLVVFDGQNRKIWASNTAGHPGAFLVLQDDHNLVIYPKGGGKALWASSLGGYAHGGFDFGRFMLATASGGMTEVARAASPQAGHFMDNAVQTAGKAVGTAEKVVMTAEGAISREIHKIPYVGGPLSSIFDAGFHAALGPTTITLAIAIHGERIDKAFLEEFNRQLKDFKEVGPYVQMVVSFVPGWGMVASAVIGAGLALANGQPIDKVVMAGAMGLVPGGPLAKAAVNMAYAGVRAAIDHTKLDVTTMVGTGVGAISDALNLPSAAKQALLAGVNIVGQLAHGVRVETALTVGAIEALPVSQSIRGALREAGDIALDLAHGKRVDKVLLSHVSDITNYLPLDDQWKKSLHGILATGTSIVQGQSIEKVVGTALQSGVGDTLVNFGRASLPKEVQQAMQTGIALGSGAVVQAQRAVQLLDKVPGKLVESGIQLAKNAPVFAEARKLVKGGTRGFDLAAGVMQHQLKPFDFHTLRESLSAIDKKGFDTAVATHIGSVAIPKPAGISPAAHAGHAIAYGIQGFRPENKMAIMEAVAANPSASVGATVAIKEVATARESWLHRLLKSLGLAH